MKSLPAGNCLPPGKPCFLLPSRAEFAGLWRWLERQSTSCGLVEDTLVRISRSASRWAGQQEVPARTMLCLEVFRERGLIDLRTHVGRIQITVRRPEEKVDLRPPRFCGGFGRRFRRIRD